jgi:hypothetical protein
MWDTLWGDTVHSLEDVATDLGEGDRGAEVAYGGIVSGREKTFAGKGGV